MTKAVVLIQLKCKLMVCVCLAKSFLIVKQLKVLISTITGRNIYNIYNIYIYIPMGVVSTACKHFLVYTSQHSSCCSKHLYLHYVMFKTQHINANDTVIQRYMVAIHSVCKTEKSYANHEMASICLYNILYTCISYIMVFCSHDINNKYTTFHAYRTKLFTAVMFHWCLALSSFTVFDNIFKIDIII